MGRARLTSTSTRLATVLATAGAVGVFVSALLPWGRSGHAHRSGFELARTADSLDLASGIVLRVLLLATWFVPLLAALTWTAAVLRRPVAVAMAAALSGALALVAVVVVVRASVVEAEAGAWTGMVAGIAAVIGGLWLLTLRLFAERVRTIGGADVR